MPGVAITSEDVRAALRGVLFPKFRRDIVTLGVVTDVTVEEGRVSVRLRPGSDKAETLASLRRGVEGAVGALDGVEQVIIDIDDASAGRGRDPIANRAALPDIRHVVAVASAKGGVGKSTVAANLAVALAGLGARVGLMDADVYGPSVPIMFGTNETPRADGQGRSAPVERHGVRLMSIGFFVDQKLPVIWRGPIVMQVVRQFLRDVQWGPLDHLIVDLPPGTGDAPLTLMQQVPLSGGVIVTTPQDVALLDVERGMAMFEKVSAPVLGIVENMSGYVCTQCGHEDPVFGMGGSARLANRFSVPLLARLPITQAVRESGDAGVPITAADPRDPVSEAFVQLARRVQAEVERVAA